MDTHVKAFYTAVANGCSHLMLSYFYRQQYSDAQFRRFRQCGVHIFMDSGAYSAWKKNVSIDIDEYIAYLQSHQIGKYVVLDIVGDPEKTQFNLDYMESKGLLPIPVFHIDSPFQYLDSLVARGHKYICLGGTVGRNQYARAAFFDECFSRHSDVYYHGLGMTDPKLILRYPWFSVDSTTWLIGRKLCELATMDGRVPLPKDMPIQERLALNVQFFRDLERKSQL